ncbi:MAG: RNA polymerase sigma factor [Planctomycetota bacterium]|jgi:RNA polymerase sigma-70 factor (ECF subfamily)
MTKSSPEHAHWISASSDEELAGRARAGSLPCFAELVTRFEGRIYNFLRRRTPIATDAEDLTQDTFLRAWERLGQYEPGRRFSTWLFTIAARLAINHHRQAKRSRRRLETVAMNPTARRFDDPADAAAERDLGRHAWALAARVLTNDQQAVLWLRYAESLPVPEIGRIMRRSALSVRVQLFRARQSLAEHLAERPRPVITPVPDKPPARTTMRQPVAGGIQ